MKGSSITRRRIARSIAAAAVVTALASGAGSSRAAGTSPTLALVAASAVASSGGRLLTADGVFSFDDLVQIPFPAAGLLVVQGSRFVRFDVDGDVREGTSPLVANGVAPGELASILALGTAATAPARLVQLQPSRFVVVLPPSFTAGAASVMLFAIHEDESFVSNAIDVVLP